MLINLSLDVTQIDKSRLKEVTRRNGATAKFLELVLIETPDGKWGDWICKQSVTQEERAARKEMPILGNGKNFEGRGGGGAPRRDGGAAAAKQQAAEPESDYSSDVPF